MSPDINLHMKLMNMPTTEEKAAIIEPIKESVIVEPVKVELKPIETHMIAPVSGQLRLGQAGQLVVLEPGLAAAGPVQPADDVQEGGFPRTGRAEADDGNFSLKH